jgi:hypothetical protein
VATRKTKMKFVVLLIVATLFVPLTFATLVKHHSAKSHSNDTKTLNPDEYLPSLCANGATVTRKERESNLESLRTCKYDRESAIAVFKKGFDIDDDDAFTIDECYEARHQYIKSYQEVFAEDCEKIFRHCDCNADRVIKLEDFETALDTCLRNCQTIEMFIHYVGSQMPPEIQALIKIRQV